MSKEATQMARLLSHILIAEHHCNEAHTAAGNCLANMPLGACTERETNTFLAATRQLTTAIYDIKERAQALINERENNDHKQNNPGETQAFNCRGHALHAIGKLTDAKTLTDMAGRRGTPESIEIAFQTIYDYLHGIANNDGNRV